MDSKRIIGYDWFHHLDSKNDPHIVVTFYSLGADKKTGRDTTPWNMVAFRGEDYRQRAEDYVTLLRNTHGFRLREEIHSERLAIQLAEKLRRRAERKRRKAEGDWSQDDEDAFDLIDNEEDVSPLFSLAYWKQTGQSAVTNDTSH